MQLRCIHTIWQTCSVGSVDSLASYLTPCSLWWAGCRSNLAEIITWWVSITTFNVFLSFACGDRCANERNRRMLTLWQNVYSFQIGVIHGELICAMIVALLKQWEGCSSFYLEMHINKKKKKMFHLQAVERGFSFLFFFKKGYFEVICICSLPLSWDAMNIFAFSIIRTVWFRKHRDLILWIPQNLRSCHPF